MGWRNFWGLRKFVGGGVVEKFSEGRVKKFQGGG